MSTALMYRRSVSAGKQWTLGISAYYHDSAACLLREGEIIAAAQEERFTRIRHDAAFPAQAIAYCLAQAGIDASALSAVAFYEKPFLKLERILQTFLDNAPFGFAQFSRAIPLWLKDKLWIEGKLKRALGMPPRFYEHHESHAASAFFPSPFEEAAILTVDGVGEWATTSLGVGRGSALTLDRELHYPHSLGLFYSAFTQFAGFKVNSAEYKLMGLAPYGEPKFVQAILDDVIRLAADGSFELNLDYFDYVTGLKMTTPRLDRLLGGPPRTPESPITQREKDIARSVQVVLEEALLNIARALHARTGAKYLCMAGGVALNCVANTRLLRDGPFEEIWVQPAAGDAGGALGAALLCAHRDFEHPRRKSSMGAALLGPSHDDAAIERFIDVNGLVASRLEDDDPIAALLESGAVVGVFRGRMEYGPRALGARSILADPRSPSMQATVNEKIKLREAFRPFAPAILREHVADYYDLDRDSPYMLFNATLLPQRALPAVTHVDRSARLQTVDRSTHPEFARLLSAFERRTGCPVLLNTSFNVRGEPIVCTPQNAYACFMSTEMDALVLGSFLLRREAQPPLRDDWRSRFAPD